MPPPDPRLALTGSQAPAETPEDQAARARGIMERMDSLVVSTIVGETRHADFRTFQVQTECAGTRCAAWRLPGTGITSRVDLRDLQHRRPSLPQEWGDGTRAVLTKNGITVLENEGGEIAP